jgi:phosphoribosylanthranilate isomerase
MTRVKICGLTRQEDVLAAIKFGADYLGFVLWPGSPRATTLDLFRSIRVKLRGQEAVGVFVNPSADEVRAAADEGIRFAQIHGEVPDWDDDPPNVAIVRAVHLAVNGPGFEPYIPDDTEGFILLDARDPVKHGGTGQTIDWTRAAAIARTRPLFLAGGLTPDNVKQAIATVKPMTVDVASGVESAPGIKDHDKLRRFIERAKEQL